MEKSEIRISKSETNSKYQMIKFPKPLTPASPHRGEDKGEGGVILNFVLAH